MRAALALALALLPGVARAVGEHEGEDAVPTMVRPGGLLLYYRSKGPLSFVSMTPKSVPASARRLGEVKGRSCQRGLSIPITAQIRPTSVSSGFGDGGYAKALEDIAAKNPEADGLYDVRVDLHNFVVLGIYRRLCTEVVARAFSLD